MDRARVLAPAIGHAERGVPLTFKNVEFFEAARATLGRSKEAARLYLGAGGPRGGGVVTHTGPASTFRPGAQGGAEGFYRGPAAKATSPAVRGAGGRLAYAYSPDVPITGLLSRKYADSQRARIDAKRAAVSEGERHTRDRLPNQIVEGHPAKFADEHTTHFACADAAGTVVSVTQTLGVPFGSGFAIPGTGLVLNNILKWMDLDLASPNAVRAGRKAGTMMSPTQVFRDGAFALSVGTPGSYGILQTTAQMLLNALEFGMSVQEAIEAPRVRVYRDRLVDAEARIAPEVRDGLAARGHQMNEIADWSWIVGGGQGLMRDAASGALMAGADPRRDGYALAI